ncbi:hypothetical protein BD413DRAFT_265646 [Trametes elegans]|nr:hypothetical protein BD413DRAFT_265646 [Trametes elegans]
MRPEKSWRPIVSITVVDRRRDHGLPHEVVLGSDGQNPNLKSTILLHDVEPSTRLVIEVFHKSQTKKKHRKRTLVGSAKLSLNEVLNQNPLPHHQPIDYDVRLSCPPPQRKSPTISGKQQHTAVLLLRIHAPHSHSHLSAHSQSPLSSRPVSPMSDEYMMTDDMLSDAASSLKDPSPSDTLIASVIGDLAPDAQPEPDKLSERSGLRRRKKKRRLKGFQIDSDDDFACASASSMSDDDPWMPPTPRDDDDYFGQDLDGCAPVRERFEREEEVLISPCVLPMNGEQMGEGGMQRPHSFPEAVVDVFAPYRDLCEADVDNDIEKAEKVLGRLLTEWYVVGASLLALAAIDAAVFGFSPDAMFAVNGFARSVVAIGSIAAGIGLVSDAWFLVLYSGASAVKFQRLAKDVYNSYFFFCLTCRLPTMCMFLSALALMFFLLSVAWTAWPTAVLVMSFVAGVLLSSQFLVYGAHRFVNCVVWAVRIVWRKTAASTSTQPAEGALQRPHAHASTQPHPQPQVVVELHTSGPGPSCEDGKVEMPIPEPATP